MSNSNKYPNLIHDFSMQCIAIDTWLYNNKNHLNIADSNEIKSPPELEIPLYLAIQFKLISIN